MQLQTTFTIKPIEKKINFTSNVLTIGSCFAVNISKKLNYFKFNYLSNPFGILFSPIAIAQIIKRATNKEYFNDDDVFIHNEVWSCFEVHSELNEIEKLELINTLNKQIDCTNKQIKRSSHFILTLGTAWVYKHLKQNKVVGNCHKIPQNQFKKQLLTTQECLTALNEITESIKKVNPNIQFVFTISPVRHIKDGFTENQRSKAHLITALHQFLEDKDASYHYFPAYELIMDDLRDYRFYGKDMLHPSELAIDYIWDKFILAGTDTYTQRTLEKIDSIQKSIAHKPFNPNSNAHQKFKTHLKQKIEAFQLEFPQIKF